MSLQSEIAAGQGTRPGAPPAQDGYYDQVEERGYGWVMFAGVLVSLLATLNFIEGIAAIGNAHFFVADSHYIAGSLNTWGWVVMLVGIAQFFVAFGIYAKNQFARWVGVLVLGVNAIAQLLMIPAYPFWSLSIFTLDILALYGLVAYGAHITRRT